MPYTRTTSGFYYGKGKRVGQYILIGPDSIPFFTNEIVKEADTIEELIQNGDLLEIDHGKEYVAADLTCYAPENVTGVIISIGKNMFKKVAIKEEGEWKLVC